MGQLYLQRFEYRGAIDKAAFDETAGAPLRLVLDRQIGEAREDPCVEGNDHEVARVSNRGDLSLDVWCRPAKTFGRARS